MMPAYNRLPAVENATVMSAVIEPSDALLGTMADSWQEDHNLLKAATFGRVEVRRIAGQRVQPRSGSHLRHYRWVDWRLYTSEVMPSPARFTLKYGRR